MHLLFNFNKIKVMFHILFLTHLGAIILIYFISQMHFYDAILHDCVGFCLKDLT